MRQILRPVAVAEGTLVPPLCMHATGDCQTALIDVRSAFRVLTHAEIEDYLRRDQPYDCAASVKSDTLGIALFTRIDSDDPTALIGLPLIRLTGMLRKAGVRVLAREA